MSTVVRRRRRLDGDTVVLCLVVVAVALLPIGGYFRVACGEWVPGAQPPPRLTECGRTYTRADDVAVLHPAATDRRVEVGQYPPIIGASVVSTAGCGDRVPTGMYLEHGDGYVGYGLSGGP